MTYSKYEKIIADKIKKNPHITHNELQKECRIPKKTFEKYLHGLISSRKIKFYIFERKKHYYHLQKITEYDQISYEPPLLPTHAKTEWRISWKLQESKDLFEIIPDPFDADEAYVKLYTYVLEDIICKLNSLIIYDAVLDPMREPHRKYIREYKKLIQNFFKIITVHKDNGKPAIKCMKKIDPSNTKQYLSTDYDVEEMMFDLTEVPPEISPLSSTIAQMYREDEDYLIKDNYEMKAMLASDMHFKISSLLLVPLKEMKERVERGKEEKEDKEKVGSKFNFDSTEEI